jgi:hypothetical protein
VQTITQLVRNLFITSVPQKSLLFGDENRPSAQPSESARNLSPFSSCLTVNPSAVSQTPSDSDKDRAPVCKPTNTFSICHLERSRNDRRERRLQSKDGENLSFAMRIPGVLADGGSLPLKRFMKGSNSKPELLYWLTDPISLDFDETAD